MFRGEADLSQLRSALEKGPLRTALPFTQRSKEA